MLAVLAAATLTMAPAQDVKPLSFANARLAAVKRCEGAARFQTSYEPALLYRRDQDTTRVKKLIEMPMGKPCLLGGASAAQDTGR